MRKALIVGTILILFAIIIPKVLADESYLIGYISEIEGDNNFTIITTDQQELKNFTVNGNTAFFDNQGNKLKDSLIIGKVVKVWAEKKKLIPLSTQDQGQYVSAKKVQYIEADEVDILPRFISKEKNKYNIYIFYNVNSFPDKVVRQEIKSKLQPFLKTGGKVNLVSYLPSEEQHLNFGRIFSLESYPSILIFDETQKVYETTEIKEAEEWLNLK